MSKTVTYYEKEDALFRETETAYPDKTFGYVFEILNNSGEFQKYKGESFNVKTNSHIISEEQFNKLKAEKK